MTGTRGLLLDLDDTLYDYAPADAVARRRTLSRIAADLSLSVEAVEAAFKRARKAVKARLGATGAGHARLLYYAEMAAQIGGIDRVRAWERLYWTTFLGQAALRPGATTVLEAWRAAGHRIAIATDLTLETQLWKLEAFDLFGLIDAIVASEEVLHDKPEPSIFVLAAARIKVPIEQCVVVGDAVDKEGALAERFALPFVQARSSATGQGKDWFEIGRALGLTVSIEAGAST